MEDKAMKMIAGLLVVVACTIVFNTAFAVPRYSAPVPQVGDSPRFDEATTQNPSAPVLQRIKQESQFCKTVEVKLMQRPLDMDFLKDSVGGVARKSTGGTAAHVQVVAIDKSTGRVIDNFGVTGDFGGGGKASIFSEKDLDKYDSEPCGMYEMSSDDYYAAKGRTIKQIEEGAIYEPYSGVGLKDMAKAGVEAGAKAVASLGPIASAAGAIAGAVGGAMAANDIYETRRHDYGVHSDGNAKMSFPIVNCQAGGDMFVKNLEGLPTVVTVKKYIQPGEKVAQPDVCRDVADKSQRHDLHNLNLDDPNGDWCKCESPGCWENTTGVKCICTKCGKVNVEYSRKALAMEARLKSEGKEGSWHMDRGEAVKAAQGK